MILKKLQNFFLYLYVFSLVFENWSMMIFDGNSLPKIIGYFLLALILVDKNLFAFKQNKQFILPLAGLLLALLISILLNLDDTKGYFWLFQTYFLNILLFTLISLILSQRPEIGKKMFFVLNAGILLTVLFYLFEFGVEIIDGRLSIFGENANKVGIFSVISIMLLLSLIFENTNKYGKKRYLFAVLFIPLMNMIAQSGSRVTFLGLLLSLGLFFLLRRSKSTGRTILIYLIGAITIVLVFNYLMEFEILHNRMARTVEDYDIAGRDRIWEWLLPEVLQKPVFGIGINGYHRIADVYFGKFYSPHNVFLELFAFSGAVGLFFFLLFYFRITKMAWKLVRIKNYVLPLVLLSFIFFIFFSGQGTGTKPFWIVYLFTMGEYLNNIPKNTIQKERTEIFYQLPKTEKF